MRADPCTAGGITNSFRDVELLAEAVDDGFASGPGLEPARADYERRRSAITMPILRACLAIRAN
jgi:hypothetical protein